MSATQIATERLDFLPETPDDVRATMDSMSGADLAELSVEWLALVHSATEPDPWIHGFVLRHRESGESIGN